MSQPVTVTTKAAEGDISKLRAGHDRADVALSALHDTPLSSKQIDSLKTLLAKYECLDSSPSRAIPTLLEASRHVLHDSRTGVAPHPAIQFWVQVHQNVAASVYLRGVLGQDSSLVINEWGARLDFTKCVPRFNVATLLLDSHSKPRNRDHAQRDEKATQQDDLSALGFTWADDLQATVVCATLVSRAKEAGLDLSENASVFANCAGAGHLPKPEIDLLSTLRRGFVRTYSGALSIDDRGRLRAHSNYVTAHPFDFAFGRPVALESKA